MKKLLSIVLSGLLLMSCVCLPVDALASDTAEGSGFSQVEPSALQEYGDFQYTINADRDIVTIISYQGTDENVTVPSEIESVPVKIIARSEILKDLEPEIKSYVVKKLIDEVDIHENTNVLEITENSIITDKGEFEGKTLIATGRVPNSEIVADIVELNDDGSIKVNEFFQTSNPHIYSAGDVTGGITLTPFARKEGISAARNMAGYLNKFDNIIVPQSLTLDLDVSFTQRQRKDEEEENNDNVEDIIIPGLGGPHAFWRILSGGTGLTKISLDTETEKIVRASQISPSSIDDTAYLAFLMNMGIEKEDFDDFLEVHPSTDAYYKILKIM